MKCPSCKLENPPAALYCDCGHKFVEGARPLGRGIRTRPQSMASDAAARLRWLAVPGWAIVGVLAAVVLVSLVYPQTNSDWFYDVKVKAIEGVAGLACAIVACVVLLATRQKPPRGR